MAATQLISIIDDEIVVKLSPIAIAQVEQERQKDSHRDGREILYRLDSHKLLEVLASSLGIASLRQGAIIIWTYFVEEPSQPEEHQTPILRTLINIDGDLTQKICRDILEHPLADRLFTVHSYLIGQISQQLTTALNDYIEQKIRPLEIGFVTFTGAIAWNDPIINISQRLSFPTPLMNIVMSQYSAILIAVVTVVLWRLISLQFLPNSYQRAIGRLFKNIQLFLENKYSQYVAIAVVSIFIGCSIALAQKSLSPNTQAIINTIKPWTELYLPIALISLRKLIIGAIGKIFLQNSFLMKLIFGRFIK
ncbi:MAG: hypothetical protein AUK48_14330 [Oscillatoriales cyanobacterium CG2_30_44_21]|nr:MAG: hypothetical protein AUK48_14330 [Oscillatoriales cyanobacterium CG2_30_44_21]